MKRTILTVVLIIAVLTACGVKPVASTQDVGEADELATLVQQGIEQTLAAVTPTPEPTFTPMPTATALPVKRIALVSSDVQLYTINTDGSGLARVTNNANLEGTYDVSADGQWIAYETNVETPDSADIYIMRSDGSEAHKLVAHSQNDFNPAWSPDGSKLLFMSDMTADRHDRDIFVVNADGSGLFNLSSSSNFDVDPAWSPDGTRITYRSGVFLTDEQIANMSSSGGSTNIVVKDINTGAAVYLPLPDGLASPSDPKWSPDGTRITYNCGGQLEKPNEPGSYAVYQGLCIAGADGSNPQVLYTAEWATDASNPSYHPDAAWSPDGSRIAFIGLLADGATSEIFTMNPDGSDIRQITSSTTELKTELAWSKDGSMLLFLAQNGSVTRRHFTLFVVNADGTGMIQLFERSKWTPMPRWLE